MKQLGDILLVKQIVTPEQLLAAIEQQGKMPMVRLGEALIALGLLSDEQLGEMLVRITLEQSGAELEFDEL